VLLISSCQLEYGEDDGSAIGESIPNFELENFIFQDYKGGKKVFEIEASRAKVFQRIDETHLESVVFTEWNDQGEILTRGQSDKAVFFGKTESAEIEGKIEFESTTEESLIQTEYLYWDGEKKTLLSRPEVEVRIEQKSGGVFIGQGFEANMREATYQFSKGVSGTLKEGDNE